MPATLTEKLNQTATSFVNHVARGNTINGIRSRQLLDRFQDLRDEAIKAGVWEAFCNSRGWSPECDGYDFFA